MAKKKSKISELHQKDHVPDEEEASYEVPEPRPLLALPGAPRKPLAKFDRSMLWVYGAPKIGKTTFASQFPGVWFVGTEPGQEWIECREPTIIDSWDNLLEWCGWVEENKLTRFEDGEPIRYICFDTVDLLFRMCQSYVCTALRIEDLSELEHGKGWARLSLEFDRVITKIRRWPFGLICISHSRDRVRKLRAGRTLNLLEPDVGAAGMRTLSSAADLIIHCFSDSIAELQEDGVTPTGRVLEKRLMMVHPASHAVAGGRMSHLLPPTLELSYDALMKSLKEGMAE